MYVGIPPGIMPGLCRYSKKVPDEYPWTVGTQAVPDNPHSVSPQYPQMMPKVPQNTPKGFWKFGNYVCIS